MEAGAVDGGSSQVFQELGNDYHFWWCEEAWRSRGENRSEAVEFESAIKSIDHQMNQFWSKFQFSSLLSISEHNSSSCVFFIEFI